MCIEAALQAHRDGTGDRRSWCGRVFLALELIAEALDHNDPDHATEIAREALAGAAQGAGRSRNFSWQVQSPLAGTGALSLWPGKIPEASPGTGEAPGHKPA